MIARRSLLSAGVFFTGAAIGGGAVSLLNGIATKTPPKAGAGQAPGLALSLKGYQQELRQAVEGQGGLSGPLRSLYGLNHFSGFLIDAARNVVLFGKHDPALPPIDIDDLTVVLRNSFAVSSEYEGSPGCTIDPMPGVADPWREQIVKVFGMPASASMGIRHVAIDYELKKISSGLSIVHPSISSVFNSSRFEAGLCADESGSQVAPRSSTHRFWFTPLYPARPRFVRDERGVLIEKPIQVQLQSEEEFLRAGERVGGTAPQPAAKRFADSVTSLLATNEVAAYSHLRNDFRLIELAQLLRFANVLPNELGYLMNDFPIRRLQVQTRVRGIRRQESGEASCGNLAASEVGSIVVGERIERYRREFRGGVEGRIEITPSDLRGDTGGKLARMRGRVLGNESVIGRSWWLFHA